MAEDGVAQKVDTFTRVSHGGGIGVGVAWKSPGKTVSSPTAAPDPAAHDERADDATTALVFDHLSSESLRLAQRATLDYVPMTGESGVRVGVFATDPGVRIVQRFTTDRALVRRAVARVMPSATSAEEQKADRTDELMGRRRELRGRVAIGRGQRRPTTASRWRAAARRSAQRETELRLIQTELNMLRSFDDLDRSHKGYDTALALLAVVQSLSGLPGRKTIVFFSEAAGLAGAVGEARLRHRRGQPRQRDRLRG